jgi:2'-5' RNA ligase
VRTFIAIELDEGIRARLCEAQDQLRACGAQVKWTKPPQMHLTLKFLGEIEEHQVEEVGAALANAAVGSKPFEMEVRGVGSFPPRGAARIVWAGLEDPSGTLDRLQHRVEGALGAAGFERETRRFHPHVTLGRVKDGRSRGLRERIQAAADVAFGVQRVSDVVLLQSMLSPKGPTYTELLRCRLTGGEAG